MSVLIASTWVLPACGVWEWLCTPEWVQHARKDGTPGSAKAPLPPAPAFAGQGLGVALLLERKL